MKFQHLLLNNSYNWLNYYVYQATPYDLNSLANGTEEAWKAVLPRIPNGADVKA